MNNEPMSAISSSSTKGYYMGIGWGNNGRMDNSDIAYCYMNYAPEELETHFTCRDAYTTTNQYSSPNLAGDVTG